jgi:hypothetical protein
LERKGIVVKGGYHGLLPKDLLDDLEKEADVKKRVKDFLDSPYTDTALLERQLQGAAGFSAGIGLSGFSGVSGYVGSSGFSGSPMPFNPRSW